ncbi:hypothetical protein LEP1GSC036_1254 [Leptospira weilii str. 2006001853]|uniref:Uncharacterized protein n=1 Tax=Leptospira weilii str. 2006001853 TaxID=1001589 RepID=A0A828Z1N2_9LEPT|nr:hypothetical protein LEP1GSC036_1254 [Leptospira weilii str. 2006001853]
MLNVEFRTLYYVEMSKTFKKLRICFKTLECRNVLDGT